MKFLTPFVISAATVLGGCQTVGPNSISLGRPDYNDVIQETSKQQVFANIVRVYKNEPTLFMDVTDVAASLTVQGTLGGSVAGIGSAAGRSRGNTVGLMYQESPTIRYAPLNGKALFAQLSSPITVDSIAALSDSIWPLPSILSFAVNYITPDYTDGYSALNAMFALDEYGVLLLSAAKSDLTIRPGSTQSANDALILYLEPGKPFPYGASQAEDAENILLLWMRLLNIYAGTQPQTRDGADDSNSTPERLRHIDMELRKLKQSTPEKNRDDAVIGFVNREIAKLRNWIEIRVAPIPPTLPATPPKKDPDPQTVVIEVRVADTTPPTPPKATASRKKPAPAEPKKEAPPVTAPRTSGVGCVPADATGLQAIFDCRRLAPLLRTRSALGILKAGAELPLIEFLTPSAYRTIRSHEWNRGKSFYTLLVTDEDSLCPGADDNVPADMPRRHKEAQDENGRKFPKGGCDNPDNKFEDWVITTTVSEWINKRKAGDDVNTYKLAYLPDANRNYSLAYPDAKYERRLGHFKRFVLAIQDTRVPQDAYASFDYQGKSYYIAGDDTISKKNFAILSQFLTMQAIESPTSPLVPTISVGGAK